MKEFIAFDIETTGTLSHLDHIVEIAAVRFADGQPDSSYQSLVGIPCPMPEEASRVNGITDSMLKGCPLIQEALPAFADFCGSALLVAHNAMFDYQFIARAVQEHQTPAPRGLIVDTYSLARKVFPGQLNYKLGGLCERLKISSGKLHRAKADAAACGKLFKKMVQKLPFETAEEIINFSGKKALKFPEIESSNQLSFF